MPPNVSWDLHCSSSAVEELLLGGMSSTPFKKARIKRDLAEQSILGVFESWGLKVISARNKLCLEFSGIASVEPNEEPFNIKYEIKFDEREKETGDVNLYILSPAKSSAAILPICFDDPIDTVRKLSRFKRPTPKNTFVTNKIKEEI